MKFWLIIAGTAAAGTTVGVVLGRTVLASSDTKEAKAAAKKRAAA